MADNSSTNSNSWTILAPEVKESGVESMGPLSEGQGELHAEPALTQSAVHSDTLTEQSHPPDPPQVTPLENSEDAAVLPSTTVKEAIPVQVENLTSLTSDLGEQGASGDGSETQPLIDTESFSDSYTHISPSPASTSLPRTSEEEEGLLQGEQKTLREECKPEEKVNEGDGLRRRNVSVLSPLYHQDEEEEEEGEEMQFRHPQREGEGDLGFTLNKCIFGALILLGLGTIFFSGVLMDLDDEADMDSKALKYPEAKKEWLKPDAQGEEHAGVQPPDIIDKRAKENQEIESLHARLQEQEVELQAAQLQVEEGTKERLRREELEAENQKMRGQLDKLPALQKEYEQENERVKRESERVNKELEALPAIKKELEHLKEKVTELTQSTANMKAATPSAGHEEVTSQQEKKKERKDKKAWDKERKEKDLRTENKEWKKDKNIQVDKQDGKGKGSKESKEWEKEDKKGRHKEEGKKRQKEHKQEDAQRWKIDDEKRELKERSGKREWKDNKKWEKEKQGEFVDRKWEKSEKEDKEWKQKSEQKDWKENKDRNRGKQAVRNDKEWKEKSGKKKDWEERKEWGDEKERGAPDHEKYRDKSQKEKTRKGRKDYHNENSERKEREEKLRGRKEKDKYKSGERTEGWKEEKKYKDKNHKKEEKMSRKGKHEASHHSYSDQKHSKDHVHVNYWAEQREKIRHYYGSTEGCADVTACAHAEGLAPVSQRDFEAFISGYLTELLGQEDQASRKEELGKLISEFFTDGVYVHDQIPFSEFVEDVADILEDLADGDDELENKMEEFATEAMEKFVLWEKGGNEEKKERNGRKRMKG